MMKLIKDLGMLSIPGKTYKKRVGVYECSICSKHFEARTETVKARNQEMCNSCASKLKRSTTKHGMRGHKLNTVINNIIQRCENPNSDNYKYYGAIGISVCEEWRTNRKAFFDWALSSGYADGLTIDRINVDGNYEPSNCRWVTQEVQTRNTRLLYASNTSGYRGVSWNTIKAKWSASIAVAGQQIHLGYFNIAEEAAATYDWYVTCHDLEHTKNNVPLVHQSLANAMKELSCTN